MKRNIEDFASLFIIVAACCWAVIGVFSRNLSNNGITSIQITTFRCLITSLCLGTYLYIKDKNKLKIHWKDIWYFFGTGICSILFFNICYFITIQLVTLSMASILLYTAPYFVMIMSVILFHEKITFKKITALLLAFIGCMLTTGIFGSSKMTITTLGILTGLGSGFGYALYSIFGRLALRKYHPFTVTAYTFIVASIGILPFSNIVTLIELSFGNMNILVNGILIAIVSTLIPFLLYTKGLEYVEAGKASIMAFIEPMVATAIGIFIFKEPTSGQNIVGIFLIFISMVLLNIKSKTVKKPTE